MDKPLNDLTKRRKEKAPTNKVRDVKWDITMGSNEIQIIQEYFENLKIKKQK
jgi:hypothetical protein